MMSRPLARDLVAVAETTDKPIFVVWGSPVGTERAYTEMLLGSRLPVFRTFGNCVQAVRAVLDYAGFVTRLPLPVRRRADRAPPAAARGSAASSPTPSRAGPPLRGWRPNRSSSAYGIQPEPDRLCTSAAQAVAAAGQLGYPVVMKACSAPSLTPQERPGAGAVGVSRRRPRYGHVRRPARRGVRAAAVGATGRRDPGERDGARRRRDGGRHRPRPALRPGRDVRARRRASSRCSRT